MTHQEIIEDLTGRYGDSIFDIHEPYGLLTLTTKRENIIDLLQYLYNHKTLQIQFLTDLCGIHYPDNIGNELGVIYHVHSLINNIRIRIKVFFPLTDPEIPTATGLYATANWMERETYDFFGIIFKGHPNLKRILNVDEMDYFPMRKEYPLEDQTRRDKQDFHFGR
ncbi:NADH-quinone oxidoreductase subunit C [Cytophagaceae bacterium DM2B3-1]|uniref:NADH-quinone oxidoreductase subunit C n=1 Tax=Xanthocytophaga flava TaxID=3048013 RepID=A0AAE3U9N9_9BACT|nr:NADH-quinone oxidoreductase subunit C [Xanthocytophaga flavus]MDJ1468247.1 NADH-quinone oxidoreductase subunit C [Xanthocytophaga flavus]MDJ1485309.1 NADH-quinone oxidoreductase subunit C [Xanthocytophaga flavus]MDJ1494614.1 NADH-quinone oxidoreductase subunit C [Xanthocytophaga flavus]